MKPAERLCLALDFPTRAEVLAAAGRFSGRVGWLKIGLEAFAAEGPALVGEVAAHGSRVFRWKTARVTCHHFYEREGGCLFRI